MAELNLDELLEFAVDLARGAGRIAMEGLSATPEIEFKGRRDLVTPVDRACEDYVVTRIQERYPEHGYLAEEGHEERGRPCRWIVDPIDGTTNFTRRLPYFSCSIALEVEGRLDLGVIYAPYLGELFYGRRGGGALFQRREGAPRPMAVSRESVLEDACLATGFAYVQTETPNHNLDNWGALCLQARGLRRAGSAALDLAYVADGRFDGFWEMHLKPFDVAAGAFLVEEAGGRVTDMLLGAEWLEGQHIIATNGPLHESLHAALVPPKPDGWLRLPE